MTRHVPAQPAQPGPHRLEQRVCYRSLDNFDTAFALPLSAETRSRLPQALRHATQKRQREFLAGRWCAKQALQGLGTGLTHVAMAEDRPLIRPGGVVGSITHTGDFAAAAVAWAADIAGLGIEEIAGLRTSDCPMLGAIRSQDLAVRSPTPLQFGTKPPASSRPTSANRIGSLAFHDTTRI